MQIISVSNSSEKLMLIIVSRLRRLLRNVLRTTKLPSVIASSDVAESVHDVYLRSMIGRQRRAEEPHQPRSQQGNHPNARSHLHGEKADELFRMGQAIHQKPPQPSPDQSTRQRQSDRFAHE